MALRFSLLILLSLLAVATARPGLFHPCNTLIISTYSFSLRPQNPNSNPNPNPNHPDLIAFVAEVHPLPRLPHHHLHHRFFLPQQSGFSLRHYDNDVKPQLPSSTSSSFRDRTKDILSVVASLLFGVACGALSAVTSYLIWSLFFRPSSSYRTLDSFTSDDDDDNNDDDIFNPKKPSGYVPLPDTATVPVKESEPAVAVAVAAPASAAPAKESA